MCETENMKEITVKIPIDVYNVLEVFEKLTTKSMERIVYEQVRAGAKLIRAQLNELPNTNMNKIIDAHGLSE